MARFAIHEIFKFPNSNIVNPMLNLSLALMWRATF